MSSIAETGAVPKPGAEWRKRYVYTRNDKDIVLYAGLLDLAHEHSGGRLHIATTLVQIPGPENGHVAICTAEAKIVDPAGITVRSTSGIGDADPDNAGPIAKKALLRLAETRAKARALRDLVNVGEALDEADDDPREPDGGEIATTHGKRSENGQAAAAATSTPKMLTSRERFDAIYAAAKAANLQQLPVLAADAPDEFINDKATELWRRLTPDAKEALRVAWGQRTATGAAR